MQYIGYMLNNAGSATCLIGVITHVKAGILPIKSLMCAAWHYYHSTMLGIMILCQVTNCACIYLGGISCLCFLFFVSVCMYYCCGSNLRRVYLSLHVIKTSSLGVQYQRQPVLYWFLCVSVCIFTPHNQQAAVISLHATCGACHLPVSPILRKNAGKALLFEMCF